mgnify:CR=1 FL=1
MHDIPLNDTQRIFADKNHNLVYKFLHEKNLPASEYYDIVIFGYLRAVQRYLTDRTLQAIPLPRLRGGRWKAKLSIPTAPTSAVSASSVLFVPVSLTPGI